MTAVFYWTGVITWILGGLAVALGIYEVVTARGKPGPPPDPVFRPQPADQLLDKHSHHRQM